MADEQSRIQLMHLLLKSVPNFDGDPNRLYRFLSICDELIDTYHNADYPVSNGILLNGIINKIVGNAEYVLNINANMNSWAAIKKTLLENFADQRDETTLNRDLILLKQYNESPEEFYYRCLQMLSTITNYIDLRVTDERLKQSKREFYIEQALQTFICGLKDPLGAQLRNFKPTTLPMALQYVQKELSIQRMHQNAPPSQLNYKFFGGPRTSGFNNNMIPFGTASATTTAMQSGPQSFGSSKPIMPAVSSASSSSTPNYSTGFLFGGLPNSQPKASFGFKPIQNQSEVNTSNNPPKVQFGQNNIN